MARKDQPSSRERILAAAVELVRTKGPTASGTAEILAKANAPRGSFYFHFPDGKEQLIAEAIDRWAAETLQTYVDALADHSVPIAQRLETFIISAADALAARDYTTGCAVAATVYEASATSPTLRHRTAEALESWTTYIANVLTDEGLPENVADAYADTIIAALEGAEMIARATQSTQPLTHVATTLGTAVAAATDRAKHRLG